MVQIVSVFFLHFIACSCNIFLHFTPLWVLCNVFRFRLPSSSLSIHFSYQSFPADAVSGCKHGLQMLARPLTAMISSCHGHQLPWSLAAMITSCHGHYIAAMVSSCYDTQLPLSPAAMISSCHWSSAAIVRAAHGLQLPF